MERLWYAMIRRQGEETRLQREMNVDIDVGTKDVNGATEESSKMCLLLSRAMMETGYSKKTAVPSASWSGPESTQRYGRQALLECTKSGGG